MKYTAINEIQDFIFSNNIFEFKIESFNRQGTLIMVGSFDLGYYHEIKIIFSDVTYISCPTSFINAAFRLPDEKDYIALSVSPFQLEDNVIVCIRIDEALNECEPENYYIIAENIEYHIEMVYYYKRENLGEGEKIAEWVE